MMMMVEDDGDGGGEIGMSEMLLLSSVGLNRWMRVRVDDWNLMLLLLFRMD